MANQFSSIQSALAILKNWYAGPIVSQFNDEIPFYREIEKGKEKFNGLQVVRPVKVLRNPGIGATSDGGNLPAIVSDVKVQGAATGWITAFNPNDVLAYIVYSTSGTISQVTLSLNVTKTTLP